MAPRPRPRTRLRTRLVAGALVASLPVTALAVAAVTRRAGRDQRAATDTFLATRARHVAATVAAFVSDREADVAVVAADAALQPAGSDLTPVLDNTLSARHDFAQLEATDLLGRPLWWTRGTAAIALPATADWFRAAAGGQAAQSGVFTDAKGALHWLITQPVSGADGRPAGIVAGDVKISALAPLLDHADFAPTGELLLTDAREQLVLSSRAGLVADNSAAQRSGTLATPAASPSVASALRGQQGAIAERDYQGRSVVSGYAQVATTGWAVIAKESRSEALAPARARGRLAAAAFGLVAIVVLLVALALATWESRRLRNVVGRGLAGARDVDTEAARLADASRNLAVEASEQLGGITRVSATAVELARSFTPMAQGVEAVAAHTGGTRANLTQAESDLDLSTEHARALARRINEVAGLAGLINDIADQTNLLALNAAIEAARADHNPGFTVVADEVRRLAERSKAAAADVARVVDNANAETNATVVAMEKGAKELRAGVDQLDRVAEVTDGLQLVAEHQRSATDHVAETVEGLAEAARRASAAAQLVAGQAGTLARAAAELEGTAASTKDSF